MALNEEHIKSLRWLYDDEESYRKAVRKLKLQELIESKQKDLVKAERKHRVKMIAHQGRRLIVGSPKHVVKYAKKLSKRQVAYGTTAIVAIGALGFASKVVFGRYFSPKQSSSVLSNSAIKADFKPLIPEGREEQITVNALKYDNQHGVITYNDKFNNADLTVSQQKLPEDLKGEEVLKNFASSFNATEVIDTIRGKIYVSSNEDGGQVAVMRYGELLIFFQASSKLNILQWVDYTGSLN